MFIGTYLRLLDQYLIVVLQAFVINAANAHPKIKLKKNGGKGIFRFHRMICLRLLFV